MTRVKVPISPEDEIEAGSSTNIPLRPSVTATASTSPPTTTAPLLSSRGEVSRALGERFHLLFDIFRDPYDPSKNPTGIVNLGVAEHYPMLPRTTARINQRFSCTENQVGYADGPWGSVALRQKIAALINRRFHPLKDVGEEEIALATGVTSMNSMAAWALLDPGEGLLLGMPAYGQFEYDFSAMAGAKVLHVPFKQTDPFSLDAISRYEAAITAAKSQGITPRVLLVCNPHNPLGRCYPRSTLIALLRLCAKHDLHYLSDEVYALSVWDSARSGPFHSILSIDPLAEAGLDPERVHCLYGMSKDFAASGLRLGCMVSRSQRVLRSLLGIANFHWVSGPAARAAWALLHDDEEGKGGWEVDGFLRESCGVLRERWGLVTGLLKKGGVPFGEGAGAGFFVWCDLGEWVECVSEESAEKVKEEGTKGQGSGEEAKLELSWRKEQKLQQLLMENKVFLPTGRDFHAERPGWFRIIFSQEEVVLTEGVRRIIEVLKRLKK